MKLDRLLETIESTLITCPGSFENVANGGTYKNKTWHADRMPESWIVACLMNSASEVGLAAIPEVRAKHDINAFKSGGGAIQSESLPGLSRVNAKIDLVLAEHSKTNDEMNIRVAMEVKGPKSNWNEFKADIDRIAELSRVMVSDEQAAVFVYVTAPLSEREQREEYLQLIKSTGRAESEFRVSKCRNEDANDGVTRCSYAYMHVIRVNSELS